MSISNVGGFGNAPVGYPDPTFNGAFPLANSQPPSYGMQMPAQAPIMPPPAAPMTYSAQPSGQLAQLQPAKHHKAYLALLATVGATVVGAALIIATRGHLWARPPKPPEVNLQLAPQPPAPAPARPPEGEKPAKPPVQKTQKPQTEKPTDGKPSDDKKDGEKPKKSDSDREPHPHTGNVSKWSSLWPWNWFGGKESTATPKDEKPEPPADKSAPVKPAPAK